VHDVVDISGGSLDPGGETNGERRVTAEEDFEGFSVPLSTEGHELRIGQGGEWAGEGRRLNGEFLLVRLDLGRTFLLDLGRESVVALGDEAQLGSGSSGFGHGGTLLHGRIAPRKWLKGNVDALSFGRRQALGKKLGPW